MPKNEKTWREISVIRIGNGNDTGKAKKSLTKLQLLIATSVHRIHKKCAKPATLQLAKIEDTAIPLNISV